MKILRTLSLVVLLVAVNTAQAQVEAILQKFRDSNSNTVLVAAHRGDWRNAPENSLWSIKFAIELGVDIVEIDVKRTSDGELVLMHDPALDRSTTGKGLVQDHTLAELRELFLRDGNGVPTRHKIPTLEEALLIVKGKVLLNLDQCYPYFSEAMAVLEKTGTVSQALFKGSFPVGVVKATNGQYLDRVIYMPIIRLDQPEAERNLDDFMRELHPIACELIFSDLHSPVLKTFPALRVKGARVWVNSLWGALCADHDDDLAMENPDATWGWLLDQGVTIIQTDRPKLLLEYLKKKGRR